MLSAKSGHVNSLLTDQCQAESVNAKAELQRVLAIIKFLAERGLPFRGNDQVIGSPNNGNFLGTLELLSQFDPFLAADLEKYGNKGEGSVSYLSSTTCDQLIAIIGKEVLSTIIEEIKTAKYYSISVDSTPDISHSDKLYCIFRYVLASQPVERFVQSIEMKGQGAAELEQSICTFLEKHQIKDCRGHSYDNGANMSGKYSGLQVRIREKIPLVDHIPCFRHSLNLVGHSAVDNISAASKFFELVENVCCFFSASTHRWELLVNGLDGLLVIKHLE